MPVKVIIPEKAIEKISAAYQNGIPIMLLAKQFGFSATTITRKLIECGLYTVQPRQFHVLIGKEVELTEKYNSGKSLNDLAMEYGVTQMVMSHFFKNNNIKTRPTTSNVNGREDEIIQDYLTGATKSDISKKYNICHSKSVNKILKMAGISERPRGELMAQGVQKAISEGKRKGGFIYTLDTSILNCIDTEAKAYFLGFFYADGHNRENKGHLIVELQERDSLILEQFRLLFKSSKPVYCEKPGYAKFIIHSKKLSKRMAELGCPQRKSFTVTFPDWIDPKLLHHFMRGYNDGDGGIYSKGKQNVIQTIGSDAFIEQFAEKIASNCLVNVMIRPTVSKGISLSVVNGTRQTLRVIDFLYKDATIYLERKRQKANQITAWALSAKPSHAVYSAGGVVRRNRSLNT